MSTDRDQIVLPGTTAPPKQTKARVFFENRHWTVTTPTPWGLHRFRCHSWTAAIRYLDRVTRRRRKS